MGHLQLSDHVVQKSPYWRANDALGHVEQRKFKFGGFLEHVPVRHFRLSSMAILYHVIAQLQNAHWMQNKHQHTNILRFKLVTSFLLDTLSFTLIWSSRSLKKSFSYRGSQIMEFSFVQSEDKCTRLNHSRNLCVRLAARIRPKVKISSVNQSEYNRVNSSLQTDRTLTRHAHKLQHMAWK